ncbi:MAG: DNA polymerase III subunit delta' [Cyanobacteria bacterium M_surface_9_m1_291]|nr:DNA polymerase III subunit delta' [Cyanobacteria bacterium M_surface_9_m1_291]
MASEGCAALFADLIGQPQAVALLAASLERGRLAPAYLLAGPEGVGRRLAALRFLEGVLAGPGGDATVRRRLQAGNHPDLLWVEPTYQHQGRLVPASQALDEGVNRRTPPQLRLEQVREVSRFLARRPVEARGCLVVIEAAEAMAEAAANALLKTLEEPGDGLLLLITAAPDQLLATIRSRCQSVRFNRLEPAALQQVLQSVLQSGQATDAEPSASASNDAADGAPASSPLPEPPEPPELLELAAGSPGALLEHRRQWRQLPSALSSRLQQLAESPQALAACPPLELLELASQIAADLEGEQQLWLLQWWQLLLWRRGSGQAVLERLNRLRGQLLAYVQPRLAWEVALLDLAQLALACSERSRAC